MNEQIKILLKKELSTLLRNKRIILITMIVLLSVSVVVPTYVFREMVKSTPSDIQSRLIEFSINFYLLVFMIPISLFVAYSAFTDIFYREKLSKTITTLLSAPVTLQEVLLAKALAIIAVAYPFLIISSIIFPIILKVTFPMFSFSMIKIYTILHLVLVLPLFLFGTVLLLGTLTFISKSARLINLIFFFIVMGLMFSVGRLQRFATQNMTSIAWYIAICAVIVTSLGIGIWKHAHPEEVITA
ncbi:MAG: ABC transporter permease subunit [Thermoplasmata archaeon]|nr:ABC transporter permease subunit [Thermoplasmata archaeon]